MKIFCALITLLIVYTVCVIVRIKYILATTHLPSITQESKTLGSGPPLKYIAAGDSTAVGVGASSVEQSYTHRIAQFLSTSHTVEYKNVGISGAKTEDVITSQIQSIVDFKPDIITLSIGANDITHLRKGNTTLTNIQTILETLTKQTSARIFITDIPIVDKATLLPFPYRKLLENKIRKINPHILSLRNDQIHVVDIYEFGWAKYSDINTTFAKDQFHPNDEGYTNWTNAFISKMQEL